MFRSKYAKDFTETFVELVFSYQGKTYHVRRSPEYMAPKKRGTGQTLRKAEAQLIYPDERQPVTKAKDVTAAVEQLLGLSYDQFTQIAMIAQGDFQKLLLAGTTQRGEIFRQLFHTGLYQQVQMKLKDASIARYKKYDEMRRSIAQYLDGVKTETASWQEAEEFDELKKIKFEGKLERSLELLKQFLEYGEAQEKELREKEDSLNQDIRKAEEAQNLVAQKRNLELKKKKAEKESGRIKYIRFFDGYYQREYILGIVNWWKCNVDPILCFDQSQVQRVLTSKSLKKRKKFFCGKCFCDEYCVLCHAVAGSNFICFLWWKRICYIPMKL